MRFARLGALCALIVSACAGAPEQGAANDGKVSRPSEYSGWSEKLYDGHQRSSFYVAMRDGTQLAVDLYRPTKNGVVASEKLPVVWMHSPYNRRSYRGGEAAETYPGFALRLAPYGYNVAVVDFRGVYASYGKNTAYNRGEWVDAAKFDAYDMTEWFAKQPWSSGKIGMWGCSATGGSQMQALTTRPPSLKAVIPMSAEFDAYAFTTTGGVSSPRPQAPPNATGEAASIATRDRLAAAVDGADGAAQLAAAVASHKDNIESVGVVPFKDSVSPATGLDWWEKSSPHAYLGELRKSDIGVLSVANWDEAGTRHGPFFTFNNLPKDNTKLLVGPATHCAWTAVKDETGFDLVTEELRFKTTATVDALNAGSEIDVPVMIGSNNGEGGFDGARTIAKLTGDAGAGAWLYQFAYVPEWRKPAQPQGAPHSAEIVYAFDSWNFSSSGDPRVNDTDRAVSRRVNSCWVAFFKMDPKAKSLTCADGFTWPAYTEARDDAARFEEKPKLVKSKTLPNGPPPGATRGSMAPD